MRNGKDGKYNNAISAALERYKRANISPEPVTTQKDGWKQLLKTKLCAKKATPASTCIGKSKRSDVMFRKWLQTYSRTKNSIQPLSSPPKNIREPEATAAEAKGRMAQPL